MREVFEETGWHLDPQSLRPAGWLHFEYLTPQLDDLATEVDELTRPFITSLT